MPIHLQYGQVVEARSMHGAVYEVKDLCQFIGVVQHCIALRIAQCIQTKDILSAPYP